MKLPYEIRNGQILLYNMSRNTKYKLLETITLQEINFVTELWSSFRFLHKDTTRNLQFSSSNLNIRAICHENSRVKSQCPKKFSLYRRSKFLLSVAPIALVSKSSFSNQSFVLYFFLVTTLISTHYSYFNYIVLCRFMFFSVQNFMIIRYRILLLSYS